MKKQSLGRGLDALIPGASGANIGAKAQARPDTSVSNVKGLTLRDIPITDVKPNKDQPRKSFTAEAIQELADSIDSRGLLQPIVVMVDASQRGKYIIIAGERRYRACKLLGKNTIHAIVKADVSESDRLELALIENIQRNDLTPLEVANAYAHLMDKFSYTQAEVAAIVGKNRSSVANTLRLLNLPSAARTSLEAGKITTGHARCLLAVEKEEDREKLLSIIIEDAISVRSAEGLVTKLKQGALNLGETLATATGAVKTATDVIKSASEHIIHKGDATATDTATTTKIDTATDTATDTDTHHNNTHVEHATPAHEGMNYYSIVRDVEASMGCKVSIASRKKGGVVQLKYTDSDDLRRIIDKLVNTK